MTRLLTAGVAIAASLAGAGASGALAGGAPAEARKLRFGELEASARLADGRLHRVRIRLDGIARGEYDVLRSTGDTLELGWPGARRRRQAGVPRCAIVTYRLRLRGERHDALERARALLPAAEEEGTRTEGALETEKVRRSAWRLHSDFIRSRYLRLRGAAVADYGAPVTRRPAATLELTMRARMTNDDHDSDCGGGNVFELGPGLEDSIAGFRSPERI